MTYSFTVSNLAETVSTGVRLTDAWSDDMAFVASSSKACSPVRGRKISCDVGSIAPGASATVSLTLRALHSGVVRSTATVSSGQADPYLPTNTQVVPTLVSAQDCGQVITRNTVLGKDIGPCAGNGVVVGADNVTLDLRGHRVFGFPGPSGPQGDAAGIRLPARTGVRVTNGSVSGFDAGVVVRGGGSNTLSNLKVEDNVGPDDPFNAELGDGIFIDDSHENKVIGNTISRNGIFDGIGIYGPGSNANVVENNVVTDTVGSGDGGPAGQGIIMNGATGGTMTTTLSSTRVAGNIVRDNASGGISNVNHVRGLIAGNTVEGNGRTNVAGNGIGVQVGFRYDSAVPMELVVQGNEVHGNDDDGIQIRRRAPGNKILNNNAADNATSGQGFDLRDLTFACGTNKWSGNSWGSGGYTPDCTSTGGSRAATTATGANAGLAAQGSSAPSSEAGNGWKRNAEAWDRLANQGR